VYICVCMYLCMCVCMYAGTYIRMYVCTYHKNHTAIKQFQYITYCPTVPVYHLLSNSSSISLTVQQSYTNLFVLFQFIFVVSCYFYGIICISQNVATIYNIRVVRNTNDLLTYIGSICDRCSRTNHIVDLQSSTICHAEAIGIFTMRLYTIFDRSNDNVSFAATVKREDKCRYCPFAILLFCTIYIENVQFGNYFENHSYQKIFRILFCLEVPLMLLPTQKFARYLLWLIVRR